MHQYSSEWLEETSLESQIYFIRMFYLLFPDSARMDQQAALEKIKGQLYVLYLTYLPFYDYKNNFIIDIVHEIILKTYSL